MQLKRITPFALAVNGLLAIAALGAVPCFANTVTVTNTNDSGAGSLRQAIADAASGDLIQFSITGTITLSSTLTIEGKNLTISGPGALLLAISGNHSVQVLVIGNGVSATISGVTIENGSSSSFNRGSGISNEGTLSVSNSTLSGNSGSLGGGIFNGGTLTLSNSTLSGNFVSNNGGGILNDGTLTVNNSTLSGNSASDIGGGILNNISGTVSIANTTLAGNSAGNGGGIESFGSATLKSALLAGNGGGNCDFGVTSASYNLSDDASCASAFTQAGDKNSTSAGFDKGLQNNGGPTQTIALLPTSSAVDAIPVASCTDTSGQPVTTDQRGITRPRGNGCDIGAYELVQAVPFSNFSAYLAIDAGKHPGFALTASFKLGTASDGIDPLTEAMTLQIANYTVTIPAGSFYQLWKAPQAPYVYRGTINGTNLLVVVLPLGGNKYQFEAGGSPAASLAGTKNPVTVSLSVGTDTGSTSVQALISTR